MTTRSPSASCSTTPRGETEHWHRWLASQPPERARPPAGTGARPRCASSSITSSSWSDGTPIDLRGEPVSNYADVPSEPLDADVRRLRRHAGPAGAVAAVGVGLRPREGAGVPDAERRHAVARRARKIVVHLLLHGVRHWAQLATTLRQQGHATDWPHDILMSDALEMTGSPPGTDVDDYFASRAAGQRRRARRGARRQRGGRPPAIAVTPLQGKLLTLLARMLGRAAHPRDRHARRLQRDLAGARAAARRPAGHARDRPATPPSRERNSRAPGSVIASQRRRRAGRRRRSPR